MGALVCTVGSSLVLLAPLAAPAGVWEVGGGGLATIDAAVALALDGDVILVHTGAYPGFTVAAKSLTIVADAGASVLVVGTIVVHSLAAEQCVTLQGLEIHGDLGEPAVRATLNDGALWIEDCDAEAQTSLGAGAGLQAVACSAVVLRRSSFIGGYGGSYFGGLGGDGVLLRESSAAVFACSLAGGNGGHGGDFTGCSTDDGEAAGNGIVVENSVVLLQACTAQGGHGGYGDYCPCCPSLCGYGGDGGAGLLSLGAAETTLIQTVLAGGLGGGGGEIACPPGKDGELVTVLGGSVIELPYSLTALEAASPLREGQTATAVASGEPFEPLAVYASLGPALFAYPDAHGFQLLAPPLLLVGAAVLPASGVLQLQAPVPELGASVQGLVLRLQAVGLTSSGSATLGEAATLVLLDAAF